MPVIQIGDCGNRQQELHCKCSNAPLLSPIPHRPPTVFKVIAEVWNSSKMNRVALPSDCHFDFFGNSVYLRPALTPATPLKIEDSLASMRSDLLRIITCWEQSGQGEGGRDHEDDVPDACGTSVGEIEDDNKSSAFTTSLATSTLASHVASRY